MDRTIDALEELYREIGLTFTGFQQQTGLTCLSGCGACCTSPDISASVFEMLPLARQLMRAGQAERVLAELQNNRDDRTCIMYIPDPADPAKQQGRCKSHSWRPLVCRAYGVYARKNKSNQRELAVCKKIALQNGPAAEASQSIADHAPLAATYRTRLDELSPLADNQILPINEAILRALEKLMLAASMSTRHEF